MAKGDETKLERGRVTTLALEVEYPDGSSRQFTVPVGNDFGGVLFDDLVLKTILGDVSGEGSDNAQGGLKTWEASGLPWQERPAYLLLRTDARHAHADTKGICGGYPA